MDKLKNMSFEFFLLMGAQLGALLGFVGLAALEEIGWIDEPERGGLKLLIVCCALLGFLGGYAGWRLHRWLFKE